MLLAIVVLDLAFLLLSQEIEMTKSVGNNTLTQSIMGLCARVFP